MTHDVFGSYSSKDKAIADAVVAALEQHNFSCWYAPRRGIYTRVVISVLRTASC